jgi:hypothetical protein
MKREYVRALAAIGSLGLASGGSVHARADEGEACLSAPVEGQELQKAGKLIEAHARFVVCASKSCPAEIVQDCARWASQVDEATPSVAIAVRDALGHELGDVLVSIDGLPPARPGALAIPLNPGLHRFVFVRAGHADVVDEAVLHEGEKNREVVATYPSPSVPSPDAGVGKAPSSEFSRPVPLSAWVAGSVTVAGLAVFGTFGALGLAARNEYGCASGCTQAQKSEVDTKYTVADVGLGVGVVALGVAAWQFFARPTVPRTSAVRFDLRSVNGGTMATFAESF